MATEKEILLIQRLLTEGADELTGEWWIDDQGRVTFDDGDVGDYAHAMKAMESALGVDLEEQGAPEIIPLEPLSEDAIRYLKRAGSPIEAISYLRAGSDPREYAIARLGWIHVNDDTFRVMRLDEGTLERIRLFVDDKLEDDSGEILVEEVSTSRTWSLPVEGLIAGEISADALDDQARSGMSQEEIARLSPVVSESVSDMVSTVMRVIDTGRSRS